MNILNGMINPLQNDKRMDEVVKLLKKAVDSDHPGAMAELGVLY